MVKPLVAFSTEKATAGLISIKFFKLCSSTCCERLMNTCPCRPSWSASRPNTLTSEGAYNGTSVAISFFVFQAVFITGKPSSRLKATFFSASLKLTSDTSSLISLAGVVVRRLYFTGCPFTFTSNRSVKSFGLTSVLNNKVAPMTGLALSVDFFQ